MADDHRVAKDPVCGASVDKLRASAVVVQAGRTLYFCSTECKATFLGRGSEERARDKPASPSAPERPKKVRLRFVVPATKPVRFRARRSSAEPVEKGATEPAVEPERPADSPTAAEAKAVEEEKPGLEAVGLVADAERAGGLAPSEVSAEVAAKEAEERDGEDAAVAVAERAGEEEEAEPAGAEEAKGEAERAEREAKATVEEPEAVADGREGGAGEATVDAPPSVHPPSEWSGPVERIEPTRVGRRFRRRRRSSRQVAVFVEAEPPSPVHTLLVGPIADVDGPANPAEPAAEEFRSSRPIGAIRDEAPEFRDKASERPSGSREIEPTTEEVQTDLPLEAPRERAQIVPEPTVDLVTPQESEQELKPGTEPAAEAQLGPTRISESATEAQIEAALAGEPARPHKPAVADIRHVVLEVTGMTCPSCALRVERAIRGSPGVITTSANVALGLAIVELDADEARLGNLVAWEERLGTGRTPGPLPQMEQPIIDEIARVGYRAVLRREVAIRRHPPLIERWLFARFGLSAVILATIAAMGLERPHGPAMSLLGLIVLLGAGIPILLDAFRRARYLSVNSSSLTTVGAVGAYAVAVNEALFRGNAVGAAPLFEGAAAVITTVLLAQLLRRRVFDQLLDRFHRALRIAPELAPGIIKAQISKGERQRSMDSLVRVGLPVAFLFVALVVLVQLSLDNTLLSAVIPALTVIAAVSFTALGLAVYLATMTGIQRAAERRVLFRDTGVMDNLAKLTTLVTTKSVVAQGTPVVQRSVFFHEDHRDMLALAAGCEAGSNQPAGRAIYSYALQQGIRPVDVRRVEVLRGYGLAARTKGRRVLIGSRVLMERDHVSLDKAQEVEGELAGQTLAYMAVDGTLVAMFAMVDRARPGMTQIVRTLRRQGVQTILLTGDPSQAARAMAKQAGMEEVMAEIPPHRRAHEVSDTWVTDGVLAIGGDPNRDGELLQVGDVSIAVSEVVPSGQPAGVWLVRGTFADLLPAIEIARYSRLVSFQNAAFTAIWNALWIFAGAIGVLGIHGPVIAGGAATLLFSMLSVSSRRLLVHRASP